MKTKELHAVAVRYQGEREAVILRKTINHKHEQVCTDYDTTRFSLLPEDNVYMVKICACEVLESSEGKKTDYYDKAM